MMMPYTPIEVIASRYSTPALAFDSTIVLLNGTTAHTASAGIKAIIGAR